MKKHILILIFILTLPACAKTITGEISKELNIDRHQVIDSQNNIPIEGVIIKIPSKNFQTKTRKDGTFDLKTQINSPTIMTAEKSGYKPYSLTLNEIKSPIQVSIEKTTPKDIIVDTFSSASKRNKLTIAVPFAVLPASGISYPLNLYIFPLLLKNKIVSCYNYN